MRNLLVVAAVFLACSRGPEPVGPAPATASPAPAASVPASPRQPTDLRGLAFKPPDGMRFYYLAFLRRGPNWTADKSEENKKLGDGHMANMERLAAEGTLVLAGPFVDSEGAGDLAGIFVLAVDSLAEAQAAIGSDPAVKAGRFTVELRAWLAADGIRTIMSPPPAAPTPPAGKN